MFRFFLVFIVLPFLHVFSGDFIHDLTSRKCEVLSLIQVVTEQSNSIESFYDGKLYLKARNIYHTNMGMTLCNGYSTILLSGLSVDQGGYYLSCQNRDVILKCVNCGYEWSVFRHASIYCPKCGGMGE